MRRSVFVLLVLTASVHAGVYSPDDPCPFNVAPDGAVEALPHQLFVAQLVDRMAPRVPNTPDPPGIPDWAYDTSEKATVAQSTYAARLGQLVAARWTQAQQLRGDDLAGHTAALLRFNAAQQATNLLDRGRVGRSYALKANRTHAFATARQWEDALTNLPDDSDEQPPPLAGTTPVQFRWQRSLDQTVYRRWLELHEADFQKWKASSETHPDATPLALFMTSSGDAIRYWESADEGKKLPADAIAVVQQLLIWAPWDDRLLWSLAEVYLAKGRIREAYSAYKMLATDEGRRFQGPRLLRPQVERVGAEYAKLPPEEAAVPVISTDDTPPKPDTSGLVFGLVDPVAFVVGVVVFVAVVGLMVALQVRAFIRRSGKNL